MSLPAKNNKEKFVRDMFNTIARRYDLLNRLMSLGMDRRWRRLAVQRSEFRPGGRALDICCGTGMITQELALTAGATGQVTGLDFSEQMLAVARENLQGFRLAKSITLVQGNAMDLPFPDDSFDCVTVGWGLRNVPDIATVLREMTRVVRPGGKVVSLDMAKPGAPVFKQLYWLYFNKLVPLMGHLWAGSRGAYNYLHDSARVFPHQQELAQMFAATGLVETGYQNLCGGVVALVEGRKPE